jgi:hypothetical protein
MTTGVSDPSGVYRFWFGRPGEHPTGSAACGHSHAPFVAEAHGFPGRIAITTNSLDGRPQLNREQSILRNRCEILEKFRYILLFSEFWSKSPRGK